MGTFAEEPGGPESGGGLAVTKERPKTDSKRPRSGWGRPLQDMVELLFFLSWFAAVLVVLFLVFVLGC